MRAVGQHDRDRIRAGRLLDPPIEHQHEVAVFLGGPQVLVPLGLAGRIVVDHAVDHAPMPVVPLRHERDEDVVVGLDDRLPDGGRALAVGHSPTNEAAVYGLTGEIVDSMSKGDGVLVTGDGDRFTVEALP